MKIKLVCFLFLSSVSSFIHAACSSEPLTAVSWNIKDLGSSKSDEEITVISNILLGSEADIIAIQEVVGGSGGPDAVDRLELELQKSDTTWDAVTSGKTTGDGTERYTYFWKTGEAELIDSYLSPELESEIDREPFVAKFKIGDNEWEFTNFHAVPTNKDPAHEIVELDQMPELAAGIDLVMGDFNLGTSNVAFKDLKDLSFTANINGKTALKKFRKYGESRTHPYDNILTRGLTICDAGIIDFSVVYSTLKEAKYISDHLPIFVRVEL